MAATLTLRTVKGTPLTNLEVDNNFSNLNAFGDVVSANVGVLSNLLTTNKSNIVSAINEIESGNLRQFAATTSADLAAVLTNETGTGFVVFSAGPTLTGTVNMESYTANATSTVRKVVENVVAIGNTGTAANINLNFGTVFTATLTGNATITVQNPGAVSSFTLILTNDATAGRTVAFAGGTFRYPNGSVARTTTANATDIWFFFTPNSGTTWYASIPMSNVS